MNNFFRCVAALTLVVSILLVPVSALTVEQAKDLLEEHYIDDLPESAAQAQTIEELLAALDDPYTVYMPKGEYQQFMDSINDAKLVGIGVSIELHEKGILISSVLENSPALEAGLASGDILLSANGVALTTLEQAQTLLAGEVGTVVTVSVLRPDGSTLELELTRREITVPTTVKHALSEDENALVLLCTSFGNETPAHFQDAIKANDEAVNAYIVDLSANPGGTSLSGCGAAGLFIGSEIMVYFRDGQDNYSHYYILPGQEALTQKPAIVLTSPYSASSSELFLGAVRDHDAGIAIGQRTKGKGVAQIAIDENNYPDLFDGDALKVTVYRFFSPAGVTNDKIGVMPTLLVSLDNAYYASVLLCADPPTEDVSNYLKLTMGGHIFFIDLNTALSPEFRPAFVELLEALPPAVQLRWSKSGSRFEETTPQQVAARLELSEYRPRTFSDLDTCAYTESINTLATYDLVNGYGDGTFRPDNSITRAEFCAMLANVLALDLPPISESAFFDVGISDWYAPAVHALHKNGLVTGYGEGSFHPNNVISQQEIVSVLAKLSTQLNMYSYNRRNITPTAEVMAEFAHFSDWAQHSAWLLYSCNVDLSELSSPQNGATRALAAHLICRLLTETGIFWQ